MATVNDEAWLLYIQHEGITFDQPVYHITADHLKEVTKREPRILAKFDTPDQLAKPIKDAGYTLIPTRNGEYKLVRGDLFVQVLPCEHLTEFAPVMRFPLATAGRGSSESQYIDQAFNTGLLGQFLNLDEMYLTIRGREYSRPFTFTLSGIDLEVASVQIEVDAGYEALHDIVLIEAKIGIPSYFNVRQIYYPYRHFSSIAPHKQVRNIFLAYNIPTTTYHIYEYLFKRLNDPLSISLRQCGVYKLHQQPRLTIHELIDANFRTRNTSLVPQADDLNKIVELLSLIDAGFNYKDDVADYFVFDPRQSSYYREATEYLGLVTSSRKHGYELTQLGILVLTEPPERKAEILAKVIINSWIFTALLQGVNKDRVITDNDIEAVIASAKNEDGSQHYGGSTIRRRRGTIVRWIKWLAEEIGCFTITKAGYELR